MRPETIKPLGRRKVVDAKLAASPTKLLRLSGLAQALGQMLGEPPATRHMELRSACHRIALTKACPDGPIEISAIKKGRKIIGHGIEGDAAAVQIAHGVTARRTMTARITGGLSPDVARRSGIRDARPRPWHKDPQVAARLETLTRQFFDAWRPFILEADDSGSWRFALVIPCPPKSGEEASGADVIVVVSDADPIVEFVHLSPQHRVLDTAPGRELRLRQAIDDQLNGLLSVSKPRRFIEIWPGVSSSGEALLHLIQATSEIADSNDWPTGEYGFQRRFTLCWDRTISNGIAHLRRRFPIELQDHAAICGNQFADPRKVQNFFAARRGWTLRDYHRANQAIAAVPILRTVITRPDISLAVREGRALEEVLRIASTSDTDGKRVLTNKLHPKTTKALHASYRLLSNNKSSASHFCDVVPLVEAIYRTNPHHPVLDGRELECVRELSVLDTVPSALKVRAALAHRNDKGRIRECEGLHDVYRWICERMAIVLFATESIDPFHRPAVAAATHDIMFPQGRGLAGLSALNRHWHADQPRLDVKLRELKSQIAISTATENGAIDSAAVLYPHFLSEPVEIDGVMMRPLVAEDDIVQEGNEMDHCVGSYVDAAAGGRSMLIAQTSRHGRSTVEVRLDSEIETSSSSMLWSLTVIQNQAFNNEEPPSAHQAAMNRLLARPRDLDALAERVRIAGSLVESMKIASYAAMSPEDLERVTSLVLSGLDRFVPAKLRGLSAQQWRARYGFGLRLLGRVETDDGPIHAAM